MIRRGFWLTLGAVIGVTGYRRAARLARSVLPAANAGRGQLALARRDDRALPPGHAGSAGRGQRRDVPGDRQGYEDVARRALAAAAVAGRSAAASAAFVRDVRAGMAEYLDRHDGRPPRTLEDRRGRHEPGSGAASPALAPARDGAPPRRARRRQAS